MYQIKSVTYLHTTKKTKHYKSISGKQFISHPPTHSKDFFTGRKTIRQKEILSMQSLAENNSVEVK